MSYPKFEVPGVKPEDIWQLFNVSNYPYYLLKVRRLIEGTCGFCTIDLSVNTVLFETAHWFVMENAIAPRSDKSGQEHQFVIPSRRHVSNIDELMPHEFAELWDVLKRINVEFGVTGGVVVIRSGDPLKNAKSMPHLHVNYHIPTGLKRVEVTIAKSREDLEKKLPVLIIFEKMRKMSEQGISSPFDQLLPSEQELVKDVMGTKGSC